MGSLLNLNNKNKLAQIVYDFWKPLASFIIDKSVKVR